MPSKTCLKRFGAFIFRKVKTEEQTIFLNKWDLTFLLVVHINIYECKR